MSTWIETGTGAGMYQFQSLAFDTCIVVQNASTANNALLITHACVGENSFWRY